MRLGITTEIQHNIVKSLVALLAILTIYALATIIYRRLGESYRAKQRFKIRLFYVSAIVYLFMMARIWVEGFTHFIAVLGLVSVGLVIVNKETIMNLIGGLIINWRDLFSEDDLILIQNYKGYVKSIGVLYITLYEVSESNNGYVSGRIIRIPNGLLATHTLINMSQSSHLLEQKLDILLSYACDLELALFTIKGIVDEVIEEFYKNKKEFTPEYFRRKHGVRLANLVELKSHISIHQHIDGPVGISLTCYYYCFASDNDVITQKIWIKLFEAFNADHRIHLAS